MVCIPAGPKLDTELALRSPIDLLKTALLRPGTVRLDGGILADRRLCFQNTTDRQAATGTTRPGISASRRLKSSRRGCLCGTHPTYKKCSPNTLLELISDATAAPRCKPMPRQ